jgi:hypothetical protein
MYKIKDLKKLLSTLPDDAEIYCVQDEVFSNGDRVPGYFPADDQCFVFENGILYIGGIDP